MSQLMRTVKRTLAAGVAITLLSGCAAALVGAAAVGVSSATDSRTIGTQVDDQSIELRVIAELNTDERFDEARIQVVSFNRAVLLIGQVSNHQVREAAAREARAVSGVARVHNELRIRDVISLKQISNDTWLTSKIKTKMATNEAVDATKVKVVTENSEVFLMGLVSAEMARAAIEVARNTNGVERVVDAFEMGN